jgi:hypothetical protein
MKKTEDTTTFSICLNIDDGTILSEINDLRNIYAIYLCSSNGRKCDNLITQFPKVRLLLRANLFSQLVLDKTSPYRSSTIAR